MTNKPLPNWTSNPEIERCKWVEDKILVLNRDKQEQTLTLGLYADDKNSVIDFGGRFNPNISEENFKTIYERINSSTDFIKEQNQIRSKIEELLNE